MKDDFFKCKVNSRERTPVYGLKDSFFGEYEIWWSPYPTTPAAVMYLAYHCTGVRKSTMGMHIILQLQKTRWWSDPFETKEKL